MCIGAGRASKSPRTSSYGEDPRALPAIPDQLNALGLAPIPEDGLASLGMLCCLLPLFQTASLHQIVLLMLGCCIESKVRRALRLPCQAAVTAHESRHMVWKLMSRVNRCPSVYVTFLQSL